jgi:hypothetical protein
MLPTTSSWDFKIAPAAMNKRLRLTFSTRTLLVGVSILALPLGLWWSPGERQRRAITPIRREGGSVYYEPHSPGWLDVIRDHCYAVQEVKLPQWPSDEVMTTLPKLKGMTKLWCSGTSFGETDCEALVGCDALNHVVCFRANLSPSFLVTLPKLRNLKSVSIRETTIDAPLAAALGQCKTITGLGLQQCQLEPGCLELIAANQSIESLSIGSSQLSDIDSEVKPLAAMPTLQRLNLFRTEIGDQGIQNLRLATSLKSIHLADTKVTDGAVDDLLCLGNLEALDIRGTAIGKEGIRGLYELPKLQRFDITAGLFSDEELDELQKARPHVILIVSEK